MDLPIDLNQVPQADALPPPAPASNPAALRSLGSTLSAKFTQYESDRKLAELKWARNARQFLGVYDPDIEKNIDKNRSRAYPKITRVKCVSMLSRLMNLLFQADDKNWAVGPSAVPNLDQEDLQGLLDGMSPPAQAGGAPPPPPTDEAIEQAIREFAKKRAGKLELVIEDQLQELGGSRSVDYVALCRKVLASGIQYGAGVLKGPFIEEQQQRRWEKDGSGRMMAVPFTAYRPRFEFVPIWDYYPDMSAKSLGQMEGQFQRIVMAKHQLGLLRDRPDFLADQITEAMRVNPDGNYTRRAFETELRADGPQNNVSEARRGKFEAIMWEGYVSGKDLAATGLEIPEAQLTQDVQAQVWMVGNVVIKAVLNPWATLETDGDMKQFHHFIFEEDETFLLGNGLPNIVRDSQMGVCAATRMMLDAGSIQRVFELNVGLLSPNQDITAVTPDKFFYRDDDNPATVQYPALRTIDLPMKLQEYQGMVRTFQDFADQETFVNAATGGDMQKGPSEPFRTASGASMLRGDAALPFKDVVRNYDMFTESIIGAILNFNRNFNADPALRGDFKPIARGATSLIAKEVLGTQLDNFAQTLTPEEKVYVKMRNLVRERARVRDLLVDDIVMDDAACDAVDARQAQAAQASAAKQDEMMSAQIREILAKTMKELAQAGKSTAAADAATANVILDALEKGIDPTIVMKPEPPTVEPQAAPMAPPVQGFKNGGYVTPAMADASQQKYVTQMAPYQRMQELNQAGVPGFSDFDKIEVAPPVDNRVAESSPLRTGIFSRYADGGMVAGPGRGDTVPAMLTPGEMVLPVDTVQAVGKDKLHKLIRNTHTRK